MIILDISNQVAADWDRVGLNNTFCQVRRQMVKFVRSFPGRASESRIMLNRCRETCPAKLGPFLCLSLKALWPDPQCRLRPLYPCSWVGAPKLGTHYYSIWFPRCNFDILESRMGYVVLYNMVDGIFCHGFSRERWQREHGTTNQ